MTHKKDEAIEVTVLGSGTCVPSLERSACAVLMQIGDRQLVFDAGPGTMRRLLEAGTDIYHIDYLCFSHFHPDHSAELVPLLFATKYPDASRRRKPLTLVGGPGFNHFFAGLTAVYGDWIQLAEDKVAYIETGPAGVSAIDGDGFRIRSAPVAHNPESVAYRVETPAGVSAVYSGDTDYSANLVSLARGADLLICESAVPDGQKVRGHLTPSLAGRMAAEASVGRLLLTHFYPACDDADLAAQCRRTYDGPLLLAEDLLRVTVG